MSQDYFQTLGINRTSEKTEINRAYRKLALKYHPQKCELPDARVIFASLAESYEVLSDDRLRAVYIQFGIKGLKDGVPPHDNFEGFPGGYKFSGDADKIFEQFFGSKNPFEDFFSTEYEPSVAAIGTKGSQKQNQVQIHGKNDSRKDRAVTVPVELKDFYQGGLKFVNVTNAVGREERIRIQIKAGWKNGTKISQLSKSGEEKLFFELVEIPHKLFQREGADLIYNHELTLLEALVGTSLEINTLDDRILRIPVYEIVSPGYTKTIAGEGFPIEEEGKKRGNLVIRFHVRFPTYFNDEQRSYLKMAFTKQ